LRPERLAHQTPIGGSAKEKLIQKITSTQPGGEKCDFGPIKLARTGRGAQRPPFGDRSKAAPTWGQGGWKSSGLPK